MAPLSLFTQNWVLSYLVVKSRSFMVRGIQPAPYFFGRTDGPRVQAVIGAALARPGAFLHICMYYHNCRCRHRTLRRRSLWALARVVGNVGIALILRRHGGGLLRANILFPINIVLLSSIDKAGPL